MFARCVALVAFALCSGAIALADGPRKPNVVEGLELTEPVVRTRPGLVKIVAKVTTPKDAKVKVVFDVEAAFDEPNIEVEYEVRDNGLVVQIVVPDVSGVINVTAVAIVNGEPTSNRMARTSITIDYRPRTLPKKEEPPPELPQPAKNVKQPAKEQVKGKVVRMYFCVDPIDGDENVNAMITSQRTKNKLRDAGIEGVLVGSDGPNFASYAEYVRNAGGVPCVLYVTAEKKVRKGLKIASDAKIEDLLKEAGD